MADKVYIHAAAGGTYIGNGGFICLNELGVQLGGMGYDVAFFDHLDGLHPDLWFWTGYPVPPIVAWESVRSDDAPIVTTWLYSWLDTLKQYPALFPRLRYWCSGELLRDEPFYDASRQFILDHVPEIAINNPSLAYAYEELGITPRWMWTNWIRDLFQPDPERRETGTIGYQPDLPFGNPKNEPDEVGDRLRAAFGDEAIIPCVGTQPEVAQAMQRCDLFLAWNKHWPLVCGAGESFGLNLFEALACGCVAVARRHSGNEVLIERKVATETDLINAIDGLGWYRRDVLIRSDTRQQQNGFIEAFYRFDDQRRAAIRGYLGE